MTILAVTTAYVTIASGPYTITTIAPDSPLSYTPEETSTFLSTLSPDNTMEDPTSFPDY